MWENLPEYVKVITLCNDFLAAVCERSGVLILFESVYSIRAILENISWLIC
jgi:hypothetical protein